MKLLHENISPLIETQFPSFLREEGPLFVAFVTEYYKWLEQTDNPLFHSRRILQYGDIDTTLDEFLPYFQSKYIASTPTNTIHHQRQLIKHSRELYETKGTIESLRLMFTMLFNEEIDVLYPGESILRPSDGVWVAPKYLELSISDRTVNYVGKDIVGSLSGARGFVERIDRRSYNGCVIDVAVISNVRLDRTTNQYFITGELISDDGVVKNAPSVVGSLTTVDIIQSGAGFESGQSVDIVSRRNGTEGTARVVDIGNSTGEVNYKLIDGGYGYTSNSANASLSAVFGTTDIYVSSNVLILQTAVSTGSSITLQQFDQITQPLTNVAFNSANTSLDVGELVFGTNSVSGVVAAGYIVAANTVGANGWVLLSPQTVANISLSSISFANTVTGSLAVGEIVYQSNGTTNTAVGLVAKANSTHLIVDQYMGPFVVGSRLRGVGSSASANVASLQTFNYTEDNFTDASITSLIVEGGVTGAVRGTAAKRNATAKIVGANTTAAGIVQASANPFVPSGKSWIFNSNNTITAVVNAVSSGAPGGFKIGAIKDTEIIYLNTDFVGTYANVALNAATFGLPANTSANVSYNLSSCLAISPINIGKISTLTERNPGSHNTTKPFVYEQQKTIYGFAKSSRIACEVYTTDGFFLNGESVTQPIQIPKIAIGISNVIGTFTSSSHEPIRQERADGTVIYGELYSATPSTISVYVANTANTFDTSNVVVGVWSGATASVSSAVLGTVTAYARGTIETITPTSIIIRRTSFQDFVASNAAIYGLSSGTSLITSNIVEVDSEYLGGDAVVDPIAGIFDGTVAAVEVVNSGVLYQDGETVELTFDGHQTPAYGIARINGNGVTGGRWVGSKGTLDSNIKIQDNEYYQEYSYEIRSGIDRSQYETAVKNISHVAGTKMFSKYEGRSVANTNIQSAFADYSRLTTITVPLVSTSLNIGDEVLVYTGSSITSSGTVYGRVDDALNNKSKLTVVDVTGIFTVGTTALTASNTSLGTIEKVNQEIL